MIFLTARDTTADKMEGLRLGSDDYMTKPFSIEELVERVKAVLRRSSGIGPGSNRLEFRRPGNGSRDPRRLARRPADRAHSDRVQACCTICWRTPGKY